jgi:cytoskeleton protein RodZ
MSTGIGDVLRAARRRQGASLTDAAAATKVRESYLVALEQEEFESLGGDVYVKGFITSYARFLAVDPEPLLATYREHALEREDSRAARGGGRRPTLDVPGAESPTARPQGAMVLMAIVVLIALVLIVLAVRGGGGDAAVATSAIIGLPAHVRRLGS